ncbi:MAG: hypothetical protein ACKOWF_15440, partial [Chloroflexota bacterium]
FGIGMAAFRVSGTRDLGVDPGELGVSFARGGRASRAGAGLAGRMASLPLGPVLVGCFLLAAAGNALVPLAASAGIAGAALLIAQQFLTDPAYTVFDINQVSLRQGMVADDMQGRVNATMRVSDVGGQMAGALIGGFAGDALGARAALWIGVLPLAVAGVWLLFSPVSRLRALPTWEPAP